MSDKKYKMEDCIDLLRNKHWELLSAGELRYPARSDFSDEQVVAIKAFFGPWPRALEAAGVKPPREQDRKALNSEKRIRAKRARTEAKKQKKSGSDSAQNKK